MDAEAKSAALRPGVELQPQQRRVADRVAAGDDLLVYHSLGAGKSLAGLAAAEAVGGPYAFVSPASLRENTRKELGRFTDGASPASALSYEDVVRGKAPPGPLGTVIVDEQHNLRNPDSARSRAVAGLASRASRKVLLTGTPIVNSPGDLAGPLSLLTGRPITPAEFEARFVGREKAPRGLLATLRGVEPGYRPVLRDARGLEALLRGKVDYHAPASPAVAERDERIEVDLGRDQANLHRWMWGKIPWSTRWKLSRDYPLTPREVSNLAGFMTGPRQASTSPLPFMRGREASPLRAFRRSTKLQRAVGELEAELARNPDGKALVFSNFIDAGLAPYSAALTARGIPHGVFKGGLTDEARKRLVADYNDGKLRALLLGPSGSEGLSTRRTSLIQQLDPHWNETRARQNKGRGIRFDSHSDLPPDERNVRVQRFISRMPQGRLARLLRRERPPTADEVLERMAAEKERLNERFREVLRRVGSEKEAAERRSKSTVELGGLTLELEYLKGDVRSGESGDGKAWSRVMRDAYGRIAGTEGADGDAVDCFLGDGRDADGRAYVVSQVDPDTGEFDEHKAMLGYGSEPDARAAYLRNYPDGWGGLGSIEAMSMDEFEDWLGPFAAEKAAAGPVLADLLDAKAKSDRRDYRGKHQVLRRLLAERPGEFVVDDPRGFFVGVSHVPSSFRMHLPRNLVPAGVEGLGPRIPKAASAPVLAEASRRRKAPAPRPAARPSLARLPRPEPAPEDALDLAVEGVRARRRREESPYRDVPATVADRVKAGAADAPGGDPFASPEALAARIAAGALATAARVELPGDFAAEKAAAAAPDAATGLFTPSIPVDAFNNVVWGDAVMGSNPFGARPAFGPADARLGTPPQVAAAVTGLVAGAGAARDSARVSPWDVAMAAGAAAGTGWLGGLVLGRTVGALAGLPPEAQRKLQEAGLWGGMLTGAVRSVFGGPR